MKARALLALAVLVPSCRAPDDDALFRLRPPEDTGIRFANVLEEDDSVYNPLDYDYLYNGAGVALGDFNGDGLLDVYFGGNMVSSRLYLNRGELRFDDVTDAAGVGTTAWATGVTTVDINQDGLLDLYVSVAGLAPVEERGNLLFVNQGADESGVPRFVEKAAEYGIDDDGYSTHGAFFDYDRDGDLDLYVLTNALEEYNRNQIRPRRADGQAESTDRLYRNDGDGSFTNVSREAGILMEGYGLGVGISDLNQDGWPDVYVANDFLSNDLVWINDGDGTFTNRAAEYLTHMTHNGMGMDMADYDNDGRVDIAVLDMLPPDNHRRKMMLMGGNYDKFQMGLDLGYEPQYMRNTLQHNVGVDPEGTPRFSEIGRLAGIHETDWSWAPLFADFDNDGLKDLFISNGYRRDVTNLDFIVYLREDIRMYDREERARLLLERLQQLPEVKLPNHAFRNRGDLTFEDRSEAWGVDIPSYSNGTAYGDLDNDGDLDLVINNLDQEAFVLENRAVQQQRGNFLRVALEGPPSNRSGYGARVTLQAAGTRQYVENEPARGYKSSVDPTLHFGLGAAAAADWVEVRWPDGTVERMRDVGANRTVRFDHASARPADPPADVAGSDGAGKDGVPAAEPLFRAASGPDYAHVEREVVDFKITPLLPHKFSLGGPGIAIGDLDGDGRDDAFIGSDRGYTAALHFQTAPGVFEAVPLPDDEVFEDMGALVFDADGDGSRDLYVVSGGSFAVTDGRRYQDRLYLNDGAGALTPVPDALPSMEASGSGVTASDYDGDGDLDLFVGGRVLPGQYPLAPRSYLLRNDSRPGAPRFTDVTEDVAPGLARIGMVNTGLWADYDADGRTDLILAGEWMNLTVFRNTGDGFVDATASAGLDGTEGWWNSLVAGDFDSDGDTDFVAGNLGLNTLYTASPDEPVRVHAADFDDNGSIDPVISRYIDGESYPVASRDLLIDQMIAMKGRFGRYVDYAGATLEETLSSVERERAVVRRAVRFESSYVENRGDGTFAVHSLPMPAQVAPIYGLLARDFDGDGHLDVIGVGNSTAPDIETGQYVGSYGTLLLGDGTGGFRPAGPESGFFTEGEGRGLAELAVDETRTVVLVARNDAPVQTFVPLATDGALCLPVQPLDTHAVITFRDGRTRRVELPYGSSYLSQSSRVLNVPPDADRVVIHDSRGGSRALSF
jgi:hypothetical protein